MLHDTNHPKYSLRNLKGTYRCGTVIGRLDSCSKGLTFSSEVAEVDSAVKLSAASLLLITSSPLQRRAEHNNYVRLVSLIARKINQSTKKNSPNTGI